MYLGVVPLQLLDDQLPVPAVVVDTVEPGLLQIGSKM